MHSLVGEVSKIVLHDLEVLLPLAAEHLAAELLVDRDVVEQELPGLAPVLWKGRRNSIPRDVPQLVQFNVRLVRVEHLVDLHALLLGLALLDVVQDLVLVLLCRLIER